MDKRDIFEILNESDIDEVSNINIKTDSQTSESAKRRIMSQTKTKKIVFPHKKFFVIAACFLLIVSLGITAFANDTFKNLLFSIFDITLQIIEKDSAKTTDSPSRSTDKSDSEHYNTNLNIIKTFVPGENILVYSNFLIVNEKVFEYQNGKMQEAPQLHCTGEYMYLGKPIAFSFDYFINTDGIITFNHRSDLTFSLEALPGSMSNAIFTVTGLEIEDILSSGQVITNDSFVDSFLIDLETGTLKAIVNRDGADAFFEKKTPKFYDTYATYQTRLFAEAKPSKEGSFISFQTNRNTFPAVYGSGKAITDYYIRNLETGDEWKVAFKHENTPYKAHWISDKIIAFLFSEAEGGIVIELYNAETKTSKLSHGLDTDEVAYANNTIYEITNTADSCIFSDLLGGKSITIEKDKRIQGMDVSKCNSENNFYILAGDDGLILYDLREAACIVIPKEALYADNILFPTFIDDEVILITTETNGVDPLSFYLVSLN